MPIYEYRRADGSTFEVIQKFTDDPLTKDPDTGKPVERVYSAPAIHFKGSGFHNTDYGSSRRAKAGGGGSDASESSSSAKTETGSESKKSEKKSESKSEAASASSSESKKSKGDSK
ncbi:MAG: zinc ribbon domain-containing protein [Thermoleophilaceae bacterium]|nr:zinc ribbon domain-containing protein [Thermoleophilaceae bacterium]